MLDFLRTWLISIVAASIFLSILLTVLPEGTIRTVARTTGGLILLLVLLRPVLNADLSSLAREGAVEKNAVDEQIAAFAAENNDKIRSQIEEKTAEAIESQAQDLGITCSARVTAVERDGTYFPESVTLDTAEEPRLANYIASQLAIDSAHQYWEEGE
jgi:stage III sporulation protein AF